MAAACPVFPKGVQTRAPKKFILVATRRGVHRERRLGGSEVPRAAGLARWPGLRRLDPEQHQALGGSFELLRTSRRCDQPEHDEELHSGRNQAGELAGYAPALRRSYLNQGDPRLPTTSAEDPPPGLASVLHPLRLAEREDVSMPVHRKWRDRRRSKPSAAAPGDRDQVEREEGDPHPLKHLHHRVHRAEPAGELRRLYH
jgi:hypothetical protein